MRLVPLDNIRRAASREVLEELSVAQEALDALPATERGKFISDHWPKWSALKQDLWKLGNMKCWYSEANLECNLAEVEHFRPKKRVTGTRHTGYWWCAFKWENYRISHPLVNKRLTDYQTGKLGGKGCYFPLKEGCDRATCSAEEVAEEIVLLDPAVASDCQLIAFDSSNGVPVPAISAEDDDWRHQRAQDSIDFYHLDEGTWNAKREDIMKAVSVLCNRVIELRSKDDYDVAEYDETVDQLAEFLGSYSEFLSAAEQALKEKSINLRF